jgi:GNAT superfamily N-acetyltransferase
VLTDSTGVPFPPIRRLGPEDLKYCVALSVDRGWSPEEAKWALLLAEAEAFGIDAPDGGLAGAVVLARYAPDLASAGMMLVAARFGRRGLGRALMTHLLTQAGNATVTLFATDLGKPLYAELGFRTIRKSAAFVGGFRKAMFRTRETTRPATAADMTAILDVDKAAFGADRGYLLRQLPAFAERLRVLESGDSITGFAAAWRTGPVAVLGPVVAASGADARRLITDLGAEVRGPIRLDLDPDRPELPEWALNRGLEPAARTSVMARGPWKPHGNPSRLFTPISVALALCACGHPAIWTPVWRSIQRAISLRLLPGPASSSAAR